MYGILIMGLQKKFEGGTIERIDSVVTGRSQGHICILNDRLFSNSVMNGVYGFPHAGKIGSKSYWRAIASLYNIGPEDIIFFHRTAGPNEGCKEIHGPFQIFGVEGEPAIFYDGTDAYPIVLEGTRCAARFLFRPIEQAYYSISDNYELIKKFETKRVWGLRHPSVMNIGAAQKKSIAAITRNQVLELMGLLYSEKHGAKRGGLRLGDIPKHEIVNYYEKIAGSSKDNAFLLNDSYLEETVSKCLNFVYDEAILYCYILRGLKVPGSKFRSDLISDFEEVNKEILESRCGISFGDLSANVVLELVPSPHLQETVDIMLCDQRERVILLMEIKKEEITQEAVSQISRYIDLFECVFTDKLILANVVGSASETNLRIPDRFKNQIKTVEYEIRGGRIRFV
jgi:hypothetical protein